MRHFFPKNPAFAFALIGALLSGCASTDRARPSKGAEPGRTYEPMDFPVIDVHTHTFPLSYEEKSTPAQIREHYLQARKEAGVGGSIAHTRRLDDGYMDLRSENVTHCSGVRLPFGAKALKELEAGLRSKKYGCMKIYLGYIHLFATDKTYIPVYKLAEKYGVPVVFHTGDTYTSSAKVKYSDPMPIDELAVDFRKVKFVIAHCGNPWIQTAAEIAYKNPNVYLDVSAFLVDDLDRMDREKVDEAVVKPLRWIFNYVEDPSKFMFGTDWPMTKITSYIGPIQRAIPREHWKAVFHDNAVQVFGLKP